MLNILGLIDISQDNAACLLQDGRLVAAAEEERFVRVKHAPGYFPANAIRYCLREGGIAMREVSYIAIGWDVNKYPTKMAEFFLRGWHTYRDTKDEKTLEWEINQLHKWDPDVYTAHILNKLIEAGFKREDIPPIRFIPHHYAHAATAYFCSGFDHAAVITLDGSGEENCTAIWEGKGGTLRKIKEYNIPNSLGWFYAAFTVHGGFQAYDGEGQYMGLAPYGKRNPKYQALLDQVLRVRPDGYSLDPTWVFYGKRTISDRFTDKFVEAFGPPRLRGGEISEQLKDVAFAAQEQLERVGLELAKLALRETGARKLCLAGGVALNCKMNGRMFEELDIDDIFIQPAAGDDGGCTLGAAAALHHELTGDVSGLLMKDVYLGPQFTETAIKAALDEAGVHYHRSASIERETAEHLAKQRVVGWFQGRMEYGPRALGSRSILTDPRDPKMKDIVNNKVKFREPWRPFCPSLLYERMDEYLVNPVFHPFMILACTIKPEARNKIPSVVHVDGTARVQTVRQQDNPRYYNVIKAFDDLTGVPVLLNTSFNVKGEPIVCTPQEAVACFLKTSIDVLAIGDYLAIKE
ncbi:MAG: nodulation protein [Dehalococcoidia bacterium]|nr:nodulation protein [Dehalococcoidia bacterium]